MAVAKIGGSLTYDKALSALGNKKEVKLGHNTWVCRRDDGDVAVKYHYTDIVTFHPDYSITVRTGGWDTSTTRGRLNDLLSDHGVYCENGNGIIEDVEGTAYWLNNSVEINPKGEITGQIPIFAEKLGTYLKKDFPTMAEAKQAIRESSLDQMEKLWGKFRGDRVFLAHHCVETFLPLALASSKTGDEQWMKVIRSRLSSTREAA